MRWSRVLNVVNVHVGGAVGDVVTGGLGKIPGDSVYEKHCFLEQHRDELRQMLLREPRAGSVPCVNFIVDACDPRAEFGYVIAEPAEYPVMSGSNTICVATALLETGMVEMVEPVTRFNLESAAGLIGIEATCADGKVTQVRFTNQPAFVYALDVAVSVPGLGDVTLDVGWGGMTYAIVDAASCGFSLQPHEARELCRVGQLIKTAAAEAFDAVHPLNSQFAGITQTLFAGPLSESSQGLTSTNAVVVSPGIVDRCPCGTGSSARMAVLHARGELAVGDRFLHRSLIGSEFDCRIESETTVGTYDAIVPSIAGQAWITGFAQQGLDPTDPFPTGFFLNDVWLGADSTPLGRVEQGI